MLSQASVAKKITLTLLALLASVALVASAVLILQKDDSASAVKASDFNPGRIIDDAVFYNAGAMTASQIQTFLNAKNPYCDTNGTGRATDWGRPDITRATLASYIRNGTHGYNKNTNFHAPPYTCLKDFKQNTPQVAAASGLCEAIPARSNRTAAQIIHDVAQACGINPQVFLVLLEKEQSLVTDIWPLNLQYQRATGFACPDNVGGACDPSFNGFFRQVYAAGRQFKLYKSRPNDYNYRAGVTNNIFWQTNGGNFVSDGRAASRRNGQCGYSRVYIENQATAALYIYTPYRPNQAAMDNYPGTGDACSAYGNRNFWFMFNGWFGSTTGGPYTKGAIGLRHSHLGGNSGILGKPIDNEVPRPDGGRYQVFQNGVISWSSTTGAWETRGAIRNSYRELGFESGSLGYPTTGESKTSENGRYQQFENGRIYWTSKTGAYAVKEGIHKLYVSYDGHTGPLGYPTENEAALPDGGRYQQFERGRIYLDDTGLGITTRNAIGAHYLKLNGHTGPLGYPTENEAALPDGGRYQQFERGRIYWSPTTGASEIRGAIGTLYLNLSAEKSFLGYPASDEIQSSRGRYQQFERGRIYWSPKTGAQSVHGGILNHYKKLGGPSGKLGFPMGGEVKSTSNTKQEYEGGYIYWKPGSVRVNYK